MNNLFERLLKLAVIVTFIYGLLTEQHFYSPFLRWLLFSSSIYFAYNSKKTTGKFGVFVYSALAILFNPFVDINFRETVWRIIDLIVCILIAISLNWKGYAESLSAKGKQSYHFIKNCVYGIL